MGTWNMDMDMDMDMHMGLLQGYSSVWVHTDIRRVEQRLVLNDVGVGHVAVGELGHLADALAQVALVGTEGTVARVLGHPHGASGVYDQHDAVWVVASDGMVRRERLGLQQGHHRICVGRVKSSVIRFLAVHAKEPPRSRRVCVWAPVWHRSGTDVQCTCE